MNPDNPSEPTEEQASGSLSRDELKFVLRELKRKMQVVAEKNGLKNVRFAEHPELDD